MKGFRACSFRMPRTGFVYDSRTHLELRVRMMSDWLHMLRPTLIRTGHNSLLRYRLTEESKGTLTRRRFVAGTVAGLAVGAVIGATGGYLGKSASTTTETSTQTTTQPAVTQTQTATTTLGIPSSWDYTADVVIMGAGTTGLSAAIEAVGAGAKVLVLEKEPSSLLADSGHCAGTLSGCGTKYQAAAGITDSPAQYFAELTGPGTDPRINPGLATLITNNGAAAIDFLTAQGVIWQPYSPLLDGTSTAPRLMAAVPNSSTYPTTLNARRDRQRRHVPVQYPGDVSHPRSRQRCHRCHCAERKQSHQRQGKESRGLGRG